MIQEAAHSANTQTPLIKGYSHTMTNNLVPTVIVNKNGVTTTVHKKPVTKSTSTKLPSPITPTITSTHLTQEERDNLIAKSGDMVGQVNGAISPHTHRLYRDTIEDIMRNSSDSAVTALHDYFSREKPTKYDQRNEQILIIVFTTYSDLLTSATINEYLALTPSLNQDNFAALQILKTLPALHHYPQLPDTEDYSTSDFQTQQQAVALITVTDTLVLAYAGKRDQYLAVTNQNGSTEAPIPPIELGVPLETDPFFKITDSDLVDLITQYPEQAEYISRIIKERGITNDTAVLKEILATDSQALREGTL